MSNTFSKETNNQIIVPAPLFRRFAALVYDSFIVFSFLLLLTTLALIANNGQSLLAYRVYFLAYLIVGTGLFLSWFWYRSGQTLGMLAWKIRLVDTQGKPLLWSKALWRYFLTIPSLAFGCIGLLWCFFDKEKQSLHDRLGGTRLITTT